MNRDNTRKRILQDSNIGEKQIDLAGLIYALEETERISSVKIHHSDTPNSGLYANVYINGPFYGAIELQTYLMGNGFERDGFYDGRYSLTDNSYIDVLDNKIRFVYRLIVNDANFVASFVVPEEN